MWRVRIFISNEAQTVEESYSKEGGDKIMKWDWVKNWKDWNM